MVAVADTPAAALVVVLVPVAPVAIAGNSDVSSVSAAPVGAVSARSVDPAGSVAVVLTAIVLIVIPVRFAAAVVTDGAMWLVPDGLLLVAWVSIGLTVSTPLYALDRCRGALGAGQGEVPTGRVTDCRGAGEDRGSDPCGGLVGGSVQPLPGGAVMVGGVPLPVVR